MGLGKSKLTDSEIVIEANTAMQALHFYVSKDGRLTPKFITALFNSINIKKSANEQEPYYRVLRHLKALGYTIISETG